MTLDSESSAGLACRSHTSVLAVLLVRVADPVDPWIVPDAVVGRIDHDDLVVLVGSVLGNPIAVKHSQTTQCTSDPLFGSRTKVACRLKMINTDRCRLAGHNTFGNWSLTSTPSNTHSIDDITFLSLEAQFACLVRSRRLIDSMNDRKLPILPSSDPKNEVHKIRLFLPPKFLQILVSSHGVVIIISIN